MSEALRKNLGQAVLTMMDPRQPNNEVVQAITSVYTLMEAMTDLSGMEGSLPRAKELDAGMALSPIKAAECILDFNRTRMLLVGLCHAIADKRKELGRAVKVLEIGSGPFAPILACAATLFKPEDFQFVVNDIFPENMDLAVDLMTDLGLQDYLIGTMPGDALKTDFTGFQPDIIFCEIMHRALLHEPQAAISMEMGRQFGSRVLFLPERTEVTAATFDAATKRGRQELGRMVTLDATSRELARRMGPEQMQEATFVSKRFRGPANDVDQVVALETAVQVYRGFHISPNTSVITDTIAGERAVPPRGFGPEGLPRGYQIDLQMGGNRARCSVESGLPFDIASIMQTGDGKDPIYLDGAEIAEKVRRRQGLNR